MVISRTGLGLETTNVTDTWPERGHETDYGQQFTVKFFG